MKIKNNFVSNSSSCSFIVQIKNNSNREISVLDLWKLYQDEVCKEIYDGYEKIEEISIDIRLNEENKVKPNDIIYYNFDIMNLEVTEEFFMQLESSNVRIMEVS